jgi:3-oxo-5alpha-steroid 4-dehydrogenase
LLVGPDGKRICDESRYGAAIGEAIVREGGRAWLLVDRAILTEARRQVRGSTLWFQRLQAWYLLFLAPVTAAELAVVATRAGVDPDGLTATVAAYNAAASNGRLTDARADPMGKPSGLLVALDRPPYSLIDFSIRARMLDPAPVLTLGGLVVAPETGAVLRADGTPVPGLYAAGRSAVGLCSRSYVSGLSIADCVFSGRRAGRHAALSR